MRDTLTRSLTKFPHEDEEVEEKQRLEQAGEIAMVLEYELSRCYKNNAYCDKAKDVL